MAVTMASQKPYNQTLCNDCIEDKHNEQDFVSSNDEVPITILKKRLASGEISKEEYEELKSTLEQI